MALILALWGAAILAVVTMSVLELTRADSRQQRGGADAVQLRAAADAAINITILAMLGPVAARPPVTGATFNVSFAGYAVRMSIQDETGKPDLNKASATVLRLIFQAAGLEAPQATAIAARLVARRAPGPDGQPPHFLQSVSALRQVPGMTEAAYRALAPIVTVYAQTPYLDPAYASNKVLEVFRAIDRAAAAQLQQRVEEAKGLHQGTRPPGVVPGHAYTITADVSDARGAHTLRRAIIRLTGQPLAPLFVYEWD
jgi:general secretion pathway protein K